MKCLIHLIDKDCGKLIKFTDTSWNKIVLSFKEWSNLDGNELNVCQQYKDVFEGSKDDALPVYGYHSKCYSRFTDKTKIARATKRVALQSGGEKQTSDESQSTSRQGLRSAATKSSTTQAVHLRGHVLPAVCIFCKKVPLFYRSHNKNFCDKLMLAETKDGGRLREAATQKEDETILRHIRDKDCVAVEVRYHLRCYKEYVRFLTRKPTVQSAVSSEVSAYETTFNIFSEDVVRKRIILNKEILRPDGYGWKVQDSEISIVWMMMDPAPSSILNYVHCKCKGKCDTKRCSCKSASVSCTDLCSCGSCENTEKTLSEHEHDYFSPDEDE